MDQKTLKKIFQISLRYKVFHILFWIANFISIVITQNTDLANCFGFCRFIIPVAQVQEGTWHISANYLYAVNATIFQMLSVYTCIYYLLPAFYTREKYFRFFIALAALIAGSALLQFFSEALYNKLIWHISVPFSYHFIVNLMDVLSATATFLIIILIQYYYNRNKRMRLLEKERLEAELNFLKAQINPHFLFNALNSIYVLMNEDKDLANQTLLRFSSMLRYQLYECNTDSIALDKEIDFIKDYIALEKMRNADNLVLTENFIGSFSNYNVAPFILIPFVENAFKHISHFDERPNAINIRLSLVAEKLYLEITNTYEEKSPSAETGKSGLGIQNVKRRLELLYPATHSLHIIKDKDTFTVRLTLTLDDH